jgi:hypothetical protein
MIVMNWAKASMISAHHRFGLTAECIYVLLGSRRLPVLEWVVEAGSKAGTRGDASLAAAHATMSRKRRNRRALIPTPRG